MGQLEELLKPKPIKPKYDANGLDANGQKKRGRKNIKVAKKKRLLTISVDPDILVWLNEKPVKISTFVNEVLRGKFHREKYAGRYGNDNDNGRSLQEASLENVQIGVEEII